MLNLSCNNIGPNGIKSITDNTLCKQLSVAEFIIGPEGAMHLARSISLTPVLTSLNLADNGIDSSSIIALAEGLSHCHNLQNLSLSYNNVGYDGAVTLARCLQSSSKLIVLNLACRNREVDGIVSLAEHFYSWRTNMLVLDLSDIAVISVGHMFLISGGIQQLYYLQELNLSDSSIMQLPQL